MKSVENPKPKKNTPSTKALWFKVLGKAVWVESAVSCMCPILIRGSPAPGAGLSGVGQISGQR